MTAIMNTTLNFSLAKNTEKAQEFFKMAEWESLVYFKSPDGYDVIAVNKKDRDGGYINFLPVWLFCEIVGVRCAPAQELVNYLEYKRFSFNEEIQSISVFNNAQEWAKEQREKRRELKKKRAYTCQKSCRWINPDRKEYTCPGKTFYCKPGEHIDRGTVKKPLDWLEYEEMKVPKKFRCKEAKETCQKSVFLAGRVFPLNGRRFVCGQSRGEGIPPVRWETTGGKIKLVPLLGIQLSDAGVIEEKKPTPAEYLLARTENISLLEEVPEKKYHISVRGVFDRVNGSGKRLFTDGEKEIVSVFRDENKQSSVVRVREANWVVSQRWHYGGERWNTEVVVKEEWLKRQSHDSADFQGLIKALEVNWNIVKKSTVWDILL